MEKNDIIVDFEVDFGEVKMPLKNIRNLKKGDVIDLKIKQNSLPKFYANKKMIGEAEIIVSSTLNIKIKKIYTNEESIYFTGIKNLKEIK